MATLQAIEKLKAEVEQLERQKKEAQELCAAKKRDMQPHHQHLKVGDNRGTRGSTHMYSVGLCTGREVTLFNYTLVNLPCGTRMLHQ